jgi:hypothetical protein
LAPAIVKGTADGAKPLRRAAPTNAHLRYQRDTKIVDFGVAWAKGSPKNG